MQFLIADTFTDSLTKLNNHEQKAVKTTVFDLQVNPANPGMQFHRIDATKDKNFWSVRVTRDIRLIVHKTASSFLVCYVDHHDKAYGWAERRKLETHPKTGAAQMVIIREKVEEIIVPKVVEQEKPAPAPKKLLKGITNEELLRYGIPEEWLADVKEVTDANVLDIAALLPSEASEALLNLATGVKPEIPEPAEEEISPFEHPDAQRRFRVMANVEELEQALDYPWEKWTIFLHPSQREIVENDYSGPARVSGSAGTGKTVVALHRAVFLARQHPDARVLVTTFSDILANSLRVKLRRLISSKPRLGDQIEVQSINGYGERLYEFRFGKPNFAGRETIRQFLEEAHAETEGKNFTTHFLITEWEQVVDAWQLTNWEKYRDVMRLGRKTRLPESHREQLWKIFEKVRRRLQEENLITHAEMFGKLTEHYRMDGNFPVEFAVVDEAQDISVAQLRFLSVIAGEPNRLFFAGDLGQRIFQQPFSWKSLGVDIRGRSKNLHINYRTSHQIRMQADLLLGPEITDVDGNVEERDKTVSVFNGPPPIVKVFNNDKQEIEYICGWLKKVTEEGILPEEIGVFVRSESEIHRAEAAVKQAGLSFRILDEKMNLDSPDVSVSTMHFAKGLEFRTVVVMACDDEVIPSMPRIESAADEADLEEIYNTERHLLYVACTRARDHLLVSGADPVSEFLDDLVGS
jgi:mRNA-degrading endonuclease RelE of RelBE toxin-antitoxin system